MSLATLSWDEELCDLFGIPMECLPEILSTAGRFGEAERIPVTASIVDQQAALFGHGCAKPGDVKITFGTGAFALAVAKEVHAKQNERHVISSLAWKIGEEKAEYALEGGVYCAASAINWCRGLRLFSSYEEIGAFDGAPAIEHGLVFVPALAGLGCPYWDRTAAGLWLGMGLDTTRGAMMQSVLEGIALRAAEVVAAMEKVTRLAPNISIDGGLANNPYFVEFLAQATGRTIVVPASTELTALGAARMALLGLEDGSRYDLPKLPEPRSSIVPEHVLAVEHLERFRSAVERARNWKT
jgi:glycerol kinase